MCCIVEEVLEAFKKSHPSVTKAHLQSDNAGCYHNAPLLSTINAISKRTGIEVTQYDFSDPQAGKNLCDRRIAPCKQRLRNFVSENNDIETAEDVKKGLESPPGICGTQVAVGQIDTSKLSKNVSKNKIPNITKYNNFAFEKEGITVWQAYGIGKGLKINTFNHVQEISGMKETSEWSQEPSRSKKMQVKTTRGKTSAMTDIVTTNKFSCLEPSCVMTFDSAQDADDHMDTGQHIMTPEKENAYDNIRRQWAAKATSVKGTTMKNGDTQNQLPNSTLKDQEQPQGWALKNKRRGVKISLAVKEYLTKIFNEGTKDGHPKANPAHVAEDLKKKFQKNELLESKTIKSFFPRLAARQKGKEIEETDDDEEEDSDLEENALEKEAFLQELEACVDTEIGLHHHLVYNDTNLCELLGKGKLEQRLRKLKLSDLETMCNFFDMEPHGAASRKATFVKPLLELTKTCTCQNEA